MASESSNRLPELAVSQEDSDQTQAAPSKFDIVKDYETQGEMTLHRLSSATAFTCGRCNKDKKAKLIATYRGRWDDLRCNGCYGQLLSKA